MSTKALLLSIICCGSVQVLTARELHKVSSDGVVYAAAPEERGAYSVGETDGLYNYGYNTGDGIAKVEVGRPDGSVIGSYRYFDPNGKQVLRSYIADEKGFRVMGNDLPISPDTPASQIPGAPAFTAAVEGTDEFAIPPPLSLRSSEPQATSAQLQQQQILDELQLQQQQPSNQMQLQQEQPSDEPQLQQQQPSDEPQLQQQQPSDEPQLQQQQPSDQLQLQGQLQWQQEFERQQQLLEEQRIQLQIQQEKLETLQRELEAQQLKIQQQFQQLKLQVQPQQQQQQPVQQFQTPVQPQMQQSQFSQLPNQLTGGFTSPYYYYEHDLSFDFPAGFAYTGMPTIGSPTPQRLQYPEAAYIIGQAR